MTKEEQGRRRPSKVVSVRDVEAAARNGRTLVIAPGTLITPAAQERARDLQVAIRPEREPARSLALPAPTAGSDPAQSLAALALAVADAPEDVFEAAKRLLLDSISVAYAGLPAFGGMIEGLAARRHGERGHVIGVRRKLPVAESALVNATLIHALGYDAWSPIGQVHPLPGVVASALALADELRLRSGRALLTAIAAGVEIACRVAAGNPGSSPFSRTGAAAAFGGVAAAGVLLELDREVLANAFGLVSRLALLPLDDENNELLVGFGAQAAVVAVRLAAGGAPGPRQALGGDRGFLRLFSGKSASLARMMDGMGVRWLTSEVAVRPFPADERTFGAIEAALRLQTDNRVDPEEIRQVVVETSGAIAAEFGALPDTSAPLADLRRSLPLLVSQALRTGQLGLNAELGAPETRSLATRIEVVAAQAGPPLGFTPVRLLVEMADGALHEIQVDEPPGGPGGGLERDRMLVKLSDCWRAGGQPAYRRPVRLLEAVEQLDRAQSLSAFWSAVSPQAGF
ncbi:MAG: MmgE/PrpD family protein [Dehalococcoidia bacterium]